MPPAKKPTVGGIAKEALTEILWHPFTYLPMAAIAGANALMPVPAWANIPLILAAIGGEIALWRRQWVPIFERKEADAFSDYLKKRNKEIAQAVAGSRLPPKTVEFLGELLESKTNIEASILEDNRINSREKDLLGIVADVTNQCVESAIEERKVTKSMEEAASTIYDLQTNIETILRPISRAQETTNKPTASELEQSTQALRHRIEEAKGVQRLLEETRTKE